MNELFCNEKTMTVKEVAEALGVSEGTIKHHIRKLFPTLMQNGKVTYLNEEQATAIKNLIGSGRNDLSNVLQVSKMEIVLTAENLMDETGFALRTIQQAIADLGYSKHGVKTLLKREEADKVKRHLVVNSLSPNKSDCADRLHSDPALRLAAMTLREIAETTGAAYSTVAAYAQKAGWTENGKQTLLDEKQVAIIVEAMKQAQHNQTKDTFQASIEGMETSKSRAVRLAVLAEKRLELEKQFNAELQAEIDELKAKNAELKPKAEVLDKITASESDISVRELAAILAVPGLGQNNLFLRLREDGYIDGFNRPYRQYIEMGIMYEKEYYVPHLDATKLQLRITQKGVAYFTAKYTTKEKSA
jgi:phage antirepressor YoqD-like protein/AraC-like DNA-binding protein